MAAEFDVTPFLGPGENLIAFQIFRWCDGSYLEDYPDKKQSHSGELRERDLTTLSFDLHQMGLAGQDSWGGLPYEQYRVPFRNYTFKFLIKPVKPCCRCTSPQSIL